MKQLLTLNKYFIKYKWQLLLGIVFIVLSNYFRILSPQITKYVLNTVEYTLSKGAIVHNSAKTSYDPLIQRFVVNKMSDIKVSFRQKIFVSGILLLAVALIGGFFMFLMRQTIIVMSRHIEFDQKNEIYKHYQRLDTNFYKTHRTGDLMNRISEDVSRVRMFTGPAIMYMINLAATIGFCVYYMLKENAELTLYVLAPLPILAFTIYYVNNIINRKSDRIQTLLSDLTTNAQESYSGIRVIKSFVQERSMLSYFQENSEAYRKNAISLAKTEAIYFPAMSLLIGLSTIITILIGGVYVINGQINIGVIGEFVMYILMLTFPVSAIGWTASMIQRAITSQRRINEFLNTEPAIQNKVTSRKMVLKGNIEFVNVNFTYPHTGIHALRNFNLNVSRGQKIAVIGKTGSGKSTVAQLMLRMYDSQEGKILYDGVDIKEIDLASLRAHISYVPQDVFLFSDTISGNIGFGQINLSKERLNKAANDAVIANEINQFAFKFDTAVGERGVTLSGGQKQRISIARAMVKDPDIVLFDDCLSAVDAKTENEIISNLYNYLENKTAVIITHRIFSLFNFDKIILLKNGTVEEEGTHSELMSKKGSYFEMFMQQQKQEKLVERDELLHI